jgi:hypothetical protein
MIGMAMLGFHPSLQKLSETTKARRILADKATARMQRTAQTSSS